MRWPWRRSETLNEKLMREAGLDPNGPDPGRHRDPEPPDPFELRPTMRGPTLLPGRGNLAEPHLNGIARPRNWHSMATVEAPDVEGDEVDFDVLPDGSILVEQEIGDAALAPFADAIERSMPPPYRAEARRLSLGAWAVAANPLVVVQLPDQDGDTVELTVRDGERELMIDGLRTFGSIPRLEQLGGARSEDYALQAQRLDGDLWEIRVDPL